MERGENQGKHLSMSPLYSAFLYRCSGAVVGKRWQAPEEARGQLVTDFHG